MRTRTRSRPCSSLTTPSTPRGRGLASTRGPAYAEDPRTWSRTSGSSRTRPLRGHPVSGRGGRGHRVRNLRRLISIGLHRPRRGLPEEERHAAGSDPGQRRQERGDGHGRSRSLLRRADGQSPDGRPDRPQRHYDLAPAPRPQSVGIAMGTGGGAAVSKVVVERNTVVQRAPGPRSRSAAYLAGGGITVLGGLWRERRSIRNIVISRNRLDTPLAWITIVGGGPSAESPTTTRSVTVSSACGCAGTGLCAPPALVTRCDHKIKGINVVAGLGGPRPRRGHWPQTPGTR
jgi:hypothetical protein